MTTTINASNSGSGGLVQTADASGILALQTAGTTAVTIDTSQNVTFAQVANLPNTFGFKNRIINGAMVIDQRNAGASVTANDGVYTVDRFVYSMSAASKGTSQQSTTTATGFTNSVLFTSSSAYTVGAAEHFSLVQKIEGFNVSDLGWGSASAQTVTLSFWVRSSLTGTFGGSISNSALNRSYPFTFTISSANTFEQKTITIAGDTTGTWVTNSGVGMWVFFNLGCGSTNSGTAGAWAGATYFSATGATSVVGTNGATFYITGVQLEKGSTATSFDYRPYGTELALCQRYYEKSYEMATVPGAAFANSTWIGTVNPAATTAILGMAYFKASKRTAPTIAFWAEDGTSSNVTMPNVAAAVACTSASRISETGFGSITLSAANTASRLAGCNWTASSEL
jgi:hypothetical protein